MPLCGQPVVDGMGATDILEQDIGRMIVTEDQHPTHQPANRLAADGIVERLPAVVHLRQIERCDCNLYRARHRERRIALDADTFAGVEIECSNSDISRTARDKRPELSARPRQDREKPLRSRDPRPVPKATE